MANNGPAIWERENNTDSSSSRTNDNSNGWIDGESNNNDETWQMKVRGGSLVWVLPPKYQHRVKRAIWMGKGRTNKIENFTRIRMSLGQLD